MRCPIVSTPLRVFVLAAALAVAGAQAQVDTFQPQIPAAEVLQLEKARELRKLKKPREAIAILLAVVTRQPGYFNAQYELGLAQSDVLDELAKSIPALEKAAALKRDHPEVTDAHVFNSLGWVYMYTGRTGDAERLFKEAERNQQQLSPDARRRLYNNLGALYLNTGRHAEAEKYLQVASQKIRQRAGITAVEDAGQGQGTRGRNEQEVMRPWPGASIGAGRDRSGPAPLFFPASTAADRLHEESA
jgi:tetratricopeptide (TPR) repeat protein